MHQFDLAPIGNCAVASLVDACARHVWFCFPRLDADPVFNALINGNDPAAGFMDVVVEGFKTSNQSYLRNTAILETILRTENGEALRVIDFAPRFRQFGRSFRPPMLVRRIEPAGGQPRITLRLRPTFGYGKAAPQISIGSNHARFIGSDLVMRVTADVGPTYILNETPFLLDRPVNLFIGSDESVLEDPDGLAKRFLHDTTAYWADWARQLAIPFDWQEAVIRAAITLKLCSYEETGAIVAALTTSIPEAPNTERNWDYRYCWLRDSYFTVNALNRLGVTRTMEHYVRFLLDTVVNEQARELHPVYPIISRTELKEYEAEALAGFYGMGPVRVGNAAAKQRQNDVYGSVVLSSAQIFWDSRIPSIGGVNLYRRLSPLGETALQNALAPDAGVWEYRNRTGVFTYSATMCWAAAHRLAMIAQKVGAADEASRWGKKSKTLQREILQRAVTREGWISGALDAEIADASVLLLPQLGLLPATDERFQRTLKIVESRLLRNGFLLRYDEADDFGSPKTAFLVCTFWYIDALVASGRQDEARELFTNLLARRNSAGLLSEDIDPKTGELWGNFPQTYSLVGLTLSAHRLSRTWEQGLWHAS
ncbi:MAG: glycoside hydrolase family 15 protein [Alphaproteobacteria bacterium]|nr:glycoside hydrolase family 15 protein [Alphaproteobacteria bacterium]MDE2492739.1 glycoside hydrolase family 15 protein [Alphaproteobacteria bacterium]